jgi:hypothetical protein
VWLLQATYHHLYRKMHQCKLRRWSVLIFDWIGTYRGRYEPLIDRLCGPMVTVPCYRSRGPGFDSRRYQIFWDVVGLERGPLSLVSITKELLEWKSSGSGPRKPRLSSVGICCADHVTLFIRTNFSTSGGRSVDIVRSWTKATEFSLWTINYTVQ